MESVIERKYPGITGYHGLIDGFSDLPKGVSGFVLHSAHCSVGTRPGVLVSKSPGIKMSRYPGAYVSRYPGARVSRHSGSIFSSILVSKFPLDSRYPGDQLTLGPGFPVTLFKTLIILGG